MQACCLVLSIICLKNDVSYSTSSSPPYPTFPSPKGKNEKFQQGCPRKGLTILLSLTETDQGTSINASKSRNVFLGPHEARWKMTKYL